MEIRIEIVYTPAVVEGPDPIPTSLRLRMTEPGMAEPDLKDYAGDTAEQLFAVLYSTIQEARLTGHLDSEAGASVSLPT